MYTGAILENKEASPMNETMQTTTSSRDQLIIGALYAATLLLILLFVLF